MLLFVNPHDINLLKIVIEIYNIIIANSYAANVSKIKF